MLIPFKNEKIKCYICKKKITLTYIECKCKNKFCSKHRHPFDHNCLFDFKKEQSEKIEKENPKIKKRKLEEI